MPYTYRTASLNTWENYLKNPALLRRRPKLEQIIRRREILGMQSRRWHSTPAELLGMLQALSEAMPGQRHFRGAWRLAFFKLPRNQAF